MCAHSVDAGVGNEASAFLASNVPVDVMVLDIRMPGKTGLEVMRDLTSRPPYPIYAMTGHVDADAQADFKYKCICTHTDTHTYIRTYIHMHTYMHMYTYVHTYIHTYMHTHIRTYVHTYTCIHICICIHTYTNKS